MPRGSGRRPKPTALKKRDGNPGKRRLNENEPVAPSGDPEMPANLPRAAQAEWKRILPELRQLGVLSSIDRAALAAYCHAFARWFQAEQEIKKLGIVIREPVLEGLAGHKCLVRVGGRPVYRLKKNPAVTVSEAAQKIMKSFLVEFGMTPAARSRIAVKPDAGKQKQADPASKYFDAIDAARSRQQIQ